MKIEEIRRLQRVAAGLERVKEDTATLREVADGWKLRAEELEQELDEAQRNARHWQHQHEVDADEIAMLRARAERLEGRASLLRKELTKEQEWYRAATKRAERLEAALRGIAELPEIDEKDGHRLRALARLELEQIGVEPVTTNEEA